MGDAIDTIIEGVIGREGDYVERANDHGGATRFGVTLKSLRAWRGDETLTADDVKNLSHAEAHEILRREYVERPGFMFVKDELLRELLVDMQVNHRPGTAVRFLQRALGVIEDGILGPRTIQALDRASVSVIFREVAALRVEHYGRIIEKDHTQAEFAAGWAARAAGFVRRIPVGG